MQWKRHRQYVKWNYVKEIFEEKVAFELGFDREDSNSCKAEKGIPNGDKINWEPRTYSGNKM